MVDYSFYRGEYCGDSIPESDFWRLSARAQSELARYDRIYQVNGCKGPGCVRHG